MLVGGLDLSLTSTGMAISDGSVFVTDTIETKGSNGDSLALQRARLDRISTEVATFFENTQYVAIEAPALGSHSGHAHLRGGLWWRVVDRLARGGIVVVSIPPSSLKMYTTGNGAAGKDLMVITVGRRFPDVAIPNNDVADAVALAAMFHRQLGQPIDGELAKKNLSALDKVDWDSA